MVGLAVAAKVDEKYKSYWVLLQPKESGRAEEEGSLNPHWDNLCRLAEKCQKKK